MSIEENRVQSQAEMIYIAQRKVVRLIQAGNTESTDFRQTLNKLEALEREIGVQHVKEYRLTELDKLTNYEQLCRRLCHAGYWVQIYPSTKQNYFALALVLEQHQGQNQLVPVAQTTAKSKTQALRQLCYELGLYGMGAAA